MRTTKGKTCLINYDNGKTVLAFPFKHSKGISWIPEPDPILIFFHTAYVNYKQVLAKRNELLGVMSVQPMNEAVINDLYSYFGLVSVFVISLFTSLEAFMNKVIPEDFVYEKKGPKKTELFKKYQLDPLPIDEKMNEVLHQATGKSFSKSHPQKNVYIGNLKEFRNSIVHLKAGSNGSTPYEFIFQKAFKYQYEEALNAVKDFMNFYHPTNPNYIEQCPCSNMD